jgi:hypothetical protein
MRATSWTGSENERHEQGNCPSSPITDASSIPPWEREHTKPTLYIIPAGTRVEVQQVIGPDRWRPYTTRINVALTDTEQRKNGLWYFRYEGYLIRVRRYLLQNIAALNAADSRKRQDAGLPPTIGNSDTTPSLTG